MKIKSFAILMLVLYCANASGQLPPRPPLGEPEEPVAAEFALQLDDIFEQYTANFMRINRFVGVATLDRTWKRIGEPLYTDTTWYIHAQDFERHVRRFDEMTSSLASLRNGTQRAGILKRSTIETNQGVMQFQTQNAVTSVDRASVEKEDDFGSKFRIQTRIDFWELPFRGSEEVRYQGTRPALAWRDLPRTPAICQEGGRVTAFHEDLKKVLARVSFENGFAWDITFSKELGSLPTRVVLSRKDNRVQAVTAIIDTKWFVIRSSEFSQPVYLPTQLHCDFFYQGLVEDRDTHELQIHWMVGNEVSDFVFSQDSELYMDPLEIKELVQAKAINRN